MTNDVFPRSENTGASATTIAALRVLLQEQWPGLVIAACRGRRYHLGRPEQARGGAALILYDGPVVGSLVGQSNTAESLIVAVVGVAAVLSVWGELE